MPQLSDSGEALAEKAFSKQSPVFDALDREDTIVRYKRWRVRTHFMQYLYGNSHILELNAGTGEDAVFFAGQGHRIHATDISSGMLTVLEKKIQDSGLEASISYEKCSYTALSELSGKGPYDAVFSNFAGLNCTDQLEKVLHSLYPLVKQQGIITLVLLPKFCLWEFLLLFKGKLKTALRRFSGKKGAVAHIEGIHFRCWYYNPSYVKKIMKKDYTHLLTEGLCVFVPPSYISSFANKYPHLFVYLQNLEASMRKIWPFRSIGDYYIISFRKK
ncbi:MAG: hypothetical protein RLZZ28_1830 [Bacteroidota bacterium]